MRFNEDEVNKYLEPLLGRYEDSFQQAWVDILEADPQTLEEITPIIRREGQRQSHKTVLEQEMQRGQLVETHWEEWG